jgi:hypothetical protein
MWNAIRDEYNKTDGYCLCAWEEFEDALNTAMKDFFPYCKGNQFNSLITFEFSSSA